MKIHRCEVHKATAASIAKAVVACDECADQEQVGDGHVKVGDSITIWDLAYCEAHTDEVANAVRAVAECEDCTDEGPR